jgi:hypothetical protein
MISYWTAPVQLQSASEWRHCLELILASPCKSLFSTPAGLHVLRLELSRGVPGFPSVPVLILSIGKEWRRQWSISYSDMRFETNLSERFCSSQSWWGGAGRVLPTDRQITSWCISGFRHIQPHLQMFPVDDSELRIENCLLRWFSTPVCVMYKSECITIYMIYLNLGNGCIDRGTTTLLEVQTAVTKRRWCLSFFFSEVTYPNFPQNGLRWKFKFNLWNPVVPDLSRFSNPTVVA